MQGNLECMNDFDINETDLTSFCEFLECLKLSYQLDKKLANSKKSEKLKKDKEKSNGKQSGKKRTNNINESSPASAKKPCLLHGTRSHTTEECKVVKEQILHMKAMYKVQDPAKCAKKCKEWKSKKAPTCKEINELVAESVKKSAKEIFDAHSKTLKKCNHENTDSDSDLEPEQYHMEDAGLDLEEVNVSENFALSDLCGRPRKCKKTNQLTPVTIVLINSWLGKSKFKKIRILLDSGSSGSIILEKFVHKLCMKNDATTSWITKGGNFQTSKKCKTTFILKEFFENKSIEWNLHVDSTPGLHRYDMILGRDVLSKLGIMLDFKDQTMTWDDSTIRV